MCFIGIEFGSEKMTSLCPYEIGMMNSGIDLGSDDIIGNGGCEMNSYNSLFSPQKYTDQASGESSSTILQDKAISSPCIDAYLDNQRLYFYKINFYT